ncbi:hypothetical protein C0993_002569, partial [Termitomyces sp. T159_Od127]
MIIVEFASEETSLSAAPTLERSRTTLNVSSNARELTSGNDSSLISPRAPPNTAPVRSNTMSSIKQAPPFGGPARGLSVKGRGANPPAPSAKELDNQLTEFYDDYLNSYSGNDGEDVLAPLPIRSGGGPAAPPD